MPQLTLKNKLSYGVADVGASLSYNAINFFLLYFLVELIHLPAGKAGAVLLIGRIFDAITDPLMGTLSDSVKARTGKRKPFILWGALPFGLSFALIWFLTPQSGFWLAVFLLSLHTLIYTIVQVPYMALTPELAPSYSERTSLSSFRVGFGTFASLIAAAAPPLVVELFNTSQALEANALYGWRLMGLSFALIMSLAYLLMFWGTQEKAQRSRVHAPFSLELYLSSFKIYGFSPMVALFMMVTLGLGVVSSMMPFYLASSLKLNAGQQTLILAILFLVAIITLPLWTFLAARLGKRSAFSLGLVLMILGLSLLVWASPAGALSFRLIFFTVLAGVATGAILLFPWAMLPDVVEFDALQNNGLQREGLLYAIFTFGQKLAFSLGAFLNAQALGYVNYEAQALQQSPEAILGIRFMVGGAAAIFFMLSLALVWRYPISRAKHEEASKALKAMQAKP